MRRVLQRLDAEGLDIWSQTGQDAPASPLVVDRGGRIFVRGLDGIQDSTGQLVLDEDVLDLLGVFQAEGGGGPDLVRSRASTSDLPDLGDRELVLALHQAGWPVLVTANYKMLRNPKELTSPRPGRRR